MYAIVETNKIKEVFKNPKPLIIEEVTYPSNIFGRWSKSELENIGVYEVIFDNTNLKDKEYYNNTAITYAFANNKVTASYGDAVPKEVNDYDVTIDGQTTTYDGLKTLNKIKVNNASNSLLQPYDWYALREMEGGTAMPSNIKTWRANVRAKANEMCTKIDDCSDLDALITLLTYVDDGSGNFTRPLGELPQL